MKHIKTYMTPTNMALGLTLGLFSIAAFSGTTDVAFQNLYTMLTSWASGYLGKSLAIGAFLAGAAIGFAKGSAMPALVGIIFAIILGTGPGIIATLITGTI